MKVSEKKMVSFQVDGAYYNALQKSVKAEGGTLSKFCRDAVEKRINRKVKAGAKSA